MTKLTKKSKKAKSTHPVSITLSKTTGKKDLFLPAVLLVIIAIAFIRFALLGVPLERDEGEYAYMGQLMLEGIPPYKEAYNMKLPGTYFLYAIILAIFGHTINAVHLGLLLVNSLTTLFLFLSFRKLFNAPLAFFTASVYALMSVSGVVLGFAAHATQFVSLFLALGLFFFASFSSNGKLLFSFLCGAMIGLSFLMKQQAVFYIVFGGIIVLAYSMLNKFPLRKLFNVSALYATGALLPYMITAFLLYTTGAFDNFWFWTFEYASKYVSGLDWESGRQQLSYTFKPMWQEWKVLWILFFAGIPSLFLIKQYSVFQRIFAVSFLIAAIMTVVPGFYFRQHYFVSFLPAVGFFAAICLEYVRQLAYQNISFSKFYYAPVLVFAIVFISTINKDKPYYLEPNPNEVSSRFYGSNPFVESPVIAEYIQANTSPGDKIAVLGSEPQIFFYADRKSSTGYIYTYAMMEEHDYNLTMQNQMIKEIESDPPVYLLFIGISTSWLKHANAPDDIFKWYDTYISNYNLEGIIDITPGGSIYKFGKEALAYQPVSKNVVFLFRRK